MAGKENEIIIFPFYTISNGIRVNTEVEKINASKTVIFLKFATVNLDVASFLCFFTFFLSTHSHCELFTGEEFFFFAKKDIHISRYTLLTYPTNRLFFIVNIGI